MNGQTATPVEVKPKHPAAVYLLGLTFTCERFAYYGGKPTLMIFLTYAAIKGGLGISKSEAAIIAANLGAFTYLAPMFGGYIADKWIGPRYCVMLGSIIMSIGWAMGYFANSVAWINALIIIVSIGTGFFKGNLNTMVGELYEKDDPRKDMGYSIVYSFVNIGTCFGPIVLGTMYMVFGFRQAYLVAAIVCLCSLFMFMAACRTLGDAGKKPNAIAHHGIDGNKAAEKVDHTKPLTKKEKSQVVVICILAMFTVFFWTFYGQGDTSLLLYADNYTNLTILGFTMPATWITTSLNGFLCIIFATPAAAIWLHIAKKRKGVEVTMTQKIAFGCIFLAVGFLIMAGAELVRGGAETRSLSIFWITGFVVFQTIGEMCFSPLGNSVISRTAPPKYLSLLMGVWCFATFISNKASGYIQGMMENFGIMQVLLTVASILIVGATILFIFNKKITELTE